MNMTEKAKNHAESCRFCWMCHHICPIGNATGQERNTARARALGISLVNRGAMTEEDIADNIYECCTCGGCVHSCTTGWDPVLFTKEARKCLALENKLPAYIQTLVQNCLTNGNAYGKTDTEAFLAAVIARHAAKTNVLLFLGADARFMVPAQAEKAIRVLEKAGESFTVLADEPVSGWQMDFLVGELEETKDQMRICAKTLDAFDTVVCFDPADAKAIRQTAKEYGVETRANVLSFPAFLASLIRANKLAIAKTDRVVTVQDAYQLSRDLEETDDVRFVIDACAVRHEMLLNGAETVWAGNILMAQYMPDVIAAVAQKRLDNVRSVGENTVVTASVSEYAAMTGVKQDAVTVLALEDLVLGEDA